MKKLAFIIAMGVYVPSTIGQNAEDALRYSQTSVTGTARFSSMGGAFGALGGDFSSLSTNPAGLAVFRKAELTFTPSFFNQKTTAEYNGTSRDDVKYNFNLGNIGLVATKLKNDGNANGWVSTAFAFGHNRINNFHSNISIEGENATSSLLDVYLNQANTGLAPADLDLFGAFLAFQTYLIDTIPGQSSAYFSQIPMNSDKLQRKSISTTGAMGETVFSFAGNYNNKLYLGAALGFDYIKYSQNAIHEEIVTDVDSSVVLKSFRLDENLYTRGNGFNLKIGMIYRVTDWVRIGAAVHTPTFYNLSDSWSSSMRAEFKDSALYNHQYNPEYTNASPNGSYDYTITTPMKAIGSVAFVIGKMGIVSADYEFIDYSAARLRASDFNYFNENNDIQNNYMATGNIKIGTEWRFDPFSVRGGYALYGNPYKNNINDGGRSSYSIGFGIKEAEYYIDLAYVLSQSSSKYYLYDPAIVNPAKVNTNSNSILLTFGFRY